MASDEISVRLDEIVESLNDVLKVTEKVPADIFDVNVQGLNQGVVRDFRQRLGNVVVAAVLAARKEQEKIRKIAEQVALSVKELEEADRISGAQADQYEAQLTVSNINTPVGQGQQQGASNAPAPNPTATPIPASDSNAKTKLT